MARRTYEERIAELRAKQARELAVKSAKERLNSIRMHLNDDDVAEAAREWKLLGIDIDLLKPAAPEVASGK